MYASFFRNGYTRRWMNNGECFWEGSSPKAVLSLFRAFQTLWQLLGSLSSNAKFKVGMGKKTIIQGCGVDDLSTPKDRTQFRGVLCLPSQPIPKWRFTTFNIWHPNWSQFDRRDMWCAYFVHFPYLARIILHFWQKSVHCTYFVHIYVIFCGFSGFCHHILHVLAFFFGVLWRPFWPFSSPFEPFAFILSRFFGAVFFLQFYDVFGAAPPSWDVFKVIFDHCCLFLAFLWPTQLLFWSFEPSSIAKSS